MGWRRWLDPRWYAYLWRRTKPDSKVYFGAVVCGLLGAAGYYLATVGTSAHAAGADAYILRRTSVVRTVLEVRNGHTVVKRIQVIQTVKLPAHAVTVSSLQTVTRAGRVKKVPVTQVKYVPVTNVRTATVDRLVTTVVTRGGKTTTVVNVQPVTVETTVPTTVEETQTQLQTVIQSQTQTVTTQRTTTVAVTTTVVHTTTQSRTVTVTTTVPGTTTGSSTTTKTV